MGHPASDFVEVGVTVKIRIGEGDAVTWEHAHSLAAAWVTRNLPPPPGDNDWATHQAYREGGAWIVEYRLAPF